MVKAKIIVLLIIITCLTGMLSGGYAQTIDNNTNNTSKINTFESGYPSWYDMMQDPDANFFETQKVFYDYWKNREIKGGGYKQFKRWEYRMERRVLPDGTIPAPDLVWNNFKAYEEAQPESFKSGTNWTELGPRILINGGGYDGLGRINSLGFHPNNQNILFIGAASGGLWQSNDGGQSWTTHSDDLPTLGVSDILINYNNPDTMYIGTGDRDGGDAYGLGVMKSKDGGKNWDFANEGMGNATVSMMVMHNSDPNIIHAATSRGIYKTVNGGELWSLKSAAAFYKDIKYKPGDMNVIYAAKTGDFYRSTDGGESWAESGRESLPSEGRFVIGVSPACDSVVYVAVANGPFTGLYESRDSGTTFSQKSDSPNIMGYSVTGDDDRSQGWYDFAIAVDPVNDSIIFIGGINQWRSDDAGVSWSCIGHWTGADTAWEIHADQHSMFFSPTDGKLYIGNDGGIYVTADRGVNWAELSNGLGISQVYKIGQSATWREKIINGYQDNGTMTYLGTLLVPWLSTGGGDGMECAIDHTDAKYSYSTLYYGAITRWINNGAGSRIAGEGFNEIDEKGAWVTPFCLHEKDPKIMFIGYNNIWISRNVKNPVPQYIEWKQISKNLISNSKTIRVVEHSPANNNLFYFVRSDKTLFRSENVMDTVGVTPIWVDLTDSLPNNSRATDLEAHPFNENIVYMTQSYRVYKSVDKGNNWEDISGSLPVIPINDIVYDLSSDEGLYIATDAGVYYKNGGDADWVFYGEGLPLNVSIEEIEIYQDLESRDESRIRVCTYGRGLWESPLGPYDGAIPPYNLTADPGNAVVTLVWKISDYQEDLAGFNIYRDSAYIGFTTTTEYSDISPENEIIYSYYVTTVREGGFESDPSNIIITKPKGPIVLPYNEDFDEGDADWEYLNVKSGWKYGTAADLNMEHNAGNQTDFFGISSVDAGATTHTHDYLISPIIDLSTFSYVTLSFDYVLRAFLSYDKLFVLYRTIENGEWMEIEELNKTIGGWNGWKNYSLDIPSAAMTSTTQIAFYYTDSEEFAWGAGIDNVQIYQNTSSIYDIELDKQLKIFPNPNNGEFEISFNSDKPSDIKITIYNIEGKKVFKNNFEIQTREFRKNFSLTDLPKGIYQLRVLTDNKLVNRKITLF